MIFPQEYKLVGIKDREHRGEQVYFSTEYLISRAGPSLYRVRSSGSGFLRSVLSLEPLAHGDEIVFHPEILDTRNRSGLVMIADAICRGRNANTVVFQGPDGHVTFVKDPDPSQILKIEVLDVSPPDPSWLVYALSRLEGCGVFGDLMISFEPHVLDLRKFDCEGAYFPCRASGLGSSLDSDPVVHERPRLVGCEVSREIFHAKYPGRTMDFVNICPLCGVDGRLVPNGPFITRCCRAERRGLTERNGWKGMVVHWGDGPAEIAEAVRCLVREIRG